MFDVKIQLKISNFLIIISYYFLPKQDKHLLKFQLTIDNVWKQASFDN